MIDQALMKANIDPATIPPDRLDEVLQKLGIDPTKVPEIGQEEVQDAVDRNAPPPAAAKQDVGELMKDATVAPATAKADEGPDPDAYHLDDKGDIVPDLPPEEWEISAILVQSRGYPEAASRRSRSCTTSKSSTTAPPPSIPPASCANSSTPSSPAARQILLVISAFVTVVAAASIMTTIYNSVAARLREIAILRALGATRTRILALICTEAVVVGLIGGLLGLLVGHLLSAIGSVYLQRTIGEGINWMRSMGGRNGLSGRRGGDRVFCGARAGPKAYSTPVATNLVAS